jgi:hypothetical protein
VLCGYPLKQIRISQNRAMAVHEGWKKAEQLLGHAPPEVVANFFLAYRKYVGEVSEA